MTWRCLSDGIWHYCQTTHPDLDERIVYVAACRQERFRIIVDKRGDKWCRYCISAEVLAVEKGGRRR